MTVPTFLASEFQYVSIAGITNVAQIITAFRNQVVTTPPVGFTPWTEPSPGLFKSPVDADGRFFDVLLTVDAADTLGSRVRNPSATIISQRRILIDVGGTEVRFYTGDKHMCIDSQRGTPEALGAGLLDLSPRSQTYHTNSMYGFGHRDGASNPDGGHPADCYGLLDNGAPANIFRAIADNTASFGPAPLLDASGFTIHHPVMLVATMSSLLRRVGRLYQTYQVDVTLAVGAEIQIPINESPLTNGTFKVVGRGNSNGNFFKIAMRKA